MRTAVLAVAVLSGALIVAAAVLLRPTGFELCVDVLSRDIERRHPNATLDPRDVEAQAARECSGHADG